MLHRRFFNFALGAAACTALFGCTSGTVAASGAGAYDEAGVLARDAAVSTSCDPLDESAFSPPPYVAAVRRSGSCTAAQIDAFYTGCLDPNSTSATCAPFQRGTGSPVDEKCAQCIVSDNSSAGYGAVVFDKSNGVPEINVAGCMQLVDSMMGQSCAQTLQTLSVCRKTACAKCAVTDDSTFQLYTSCLIQAESSTCSRFTATCLEAEADGGAALCFQGATFRESYNQIVPVFCGN